MRKLAMAGAIAAATLSWAHVARADDAAHKRQDAAKHEAKQDTDRAQHSRDVMTGEKKSMFEGKDNFDVKGKVSKVSADSLTIARDDLPAATLKVSGATKIEVGGDKAMLSQLRQGEDVKASFNLEGDKPVAIEIKAEKPKDSGERANRRENMGERTTK